MYGEVATVPYLLQIRRIAGPRLLEAVTTEHEDGVRQG